MCPNSIIGNVIRTLKTEILSSVIYNTFMFIYQTNNYNMYNTFGYEKRRFDDPPVASLDDAVSPRVAETRSTV